jgi:hypothetical protein
MNLLIRGGVYKAPHVPQKKVQRARTLAGSRGGATSALLLVSTSHGWNVTELTSCHYASIIRAAAVTGA